MGMKKIMSFVGLGAMVVMLISLFLPFISNSGFSQNLWDTLKTNHFNVIVLIEIIVGMAIVGLSICKIIKNPTVALFTTGFYLTYLIGFLFYVLDVAGLEYLGFGYYLGFVSSLAATVALIVEYFLKDDMVNNNNINNNMGYNNNQQMGQPYYNPQMAQPYYNQQPTIIGYDQQGQPIYKQ